MSSPWLIQKLLENSTYCQQWANCENRTLDEWDLHAANQPPCVVSSLCPTTKEGQMEYVYGPNWEKMDRYAPALRGACSAISPSGPLTCPADATAWCQRNFPGTTCRGGDGMGCRCSK